MALRLTLQCSEVYKGGSSSMGLFFWLFLVLAALWLILWLGVHITSGLIHLLIIVAVISLIVHLVRGGRKSTTV